ncbi:hypothetical protein [Streptomyces sp. 900105755]
MSTATACVDTRLAAAAVSPIEAVLKTADAPAHTRGYRRLLKSARQQRRWLLRIASPPGRRRRHPPSLDVQLVTGTDLNAELKHHEINTIVLVGLTS